MKTLFLAILYAIIAFFATDYNPLAAIGAFLLTIIGIPLIRVLRKITKIMEEEI